MVSDIIIIVISWYNNNSNNNNNDIIIILLSLLGDFNAKVRRENTFQPTIKPKAYIQKLMIMVLD